MLWFCSCSVGGYKRQSRLLTSHFPLKRGVKRQIRNQGQGCSGRSWRRCPSQVLVFATKSTGPLGKTPSQKRATSRLLLGSKSRCCLCTNFFGVNGNHKNPPAGFVKSHLEIPRSGKIEAKGPGSHMDHVLSRWLLAPRQCDTCHENSPASREIPSKSSQGAYFLG